VESSPAVSVGKVESPPAVSVNSTATDEYVLADATVAAMDELTLADAPVSGHASSWDSIIASEEQALKLEGALAQEDEIVDTKKRDGDRAWPLRRGRSTQRLPSHRSRRPACRLRITP